jgi:hypothetical protein
MLPVRINDAITIPFVLDSGSAEVAIPLDVFSVLRRTGTITQSDFLGTRTYTLADGSATSSDRYVIHKMAVGNLVISNVIANVAPVQGDPLLGQSFLSKLPGWAMDNAQHALILRDEDRTTPSPRRSVQPQTGMVILQRPSSSPLPPGVPAPPTEPRRILLLSKDAGAPAYRPPADVARRRPSWRGRDLGYDLQQRPHRAARRVAQLGLPGYRPADRTDG